MDKFDIYKTQRPARYGCLSAKLDYTHEDSPRIAGIAVSEKSGCGAAIWRQNPVDHIQLWCPKWSNLKQFVDRYRYVPVYPKSTGY